MKLPDEFVSVLNHNFKTTDENIRDLHTEITSLKHELNLKSGEINDLRVELESLKRDVYNLIRRSNYE